MIDIIVNPTSDSATITAWISISIAVAAAIITWFAYLPIKGHKISILTTLYMGSLLTNRHGSLILFNHKNKFEVICKIYAKLKNGSFVSLDIEQKNQLEAKNIDENTPLIIEPYQTKQVYIRRASYFKQGTMGKNEPIFNNLDIYNNIEDYYIIFSDGKILSADHFNPLIKKVNFENNNIIIYRQVCSGKVRIKDKAILEFNLYNLFGNIEIVFLDNKNILLIDKKDCSKEKIKKKILKYRKLPKNCKINIDANFNDLLKSLQ